MLADIKLASEKRQEELLNEDIDKRLDLLLDNYQRVTSNPRSMGYLRFLLKHYAKSATPWRDCFTADTPVDCPRDHERYPDGIPISQIKVGQKVWSFNCNEECFELKDVLWSGITRKNSSLYKVTLDNNKSIRATGDHHFLKRSGDWCKLSELNIGDSLMPLYRDFTPRIKVKPNAIGTWNDEHQVVVDQVFSDERLGLAAHHIDSRYKNTSIDNFELLTGSQHRRKHSETVQERFDLIGHMWKCAECDSEYKPRNGSQRFCDSCRLEKRNFLKEPIKCRDCETLFVRTKSHHRYCADCREKKTELKIKGHKLICDKCDKGFIANSVNHKYCSIECRDSSRDMQKKKSGKKTLKKPFPCKMCGVDFIRKHSNNRYCNNCKEIKDNKETLTRICLNCNDPFAAIANQKYCSVPCREEYKPILAGKSGWNHKVVSIERLEETEDTWDIEVKHNHSFVVNGVVVHNCYKDNLKRFGPDKTKGLCGVLKDTLRQTSYWRGKKGHSKVPDVGAPGVAIAYGDKSAANPPWHGSNLSELDMGEMAVPDDICLIMEDLGKQCDPYRVLIGLDSAPYPSTELESLLL